MKDIDVKITVSSEVVPIAHTLYPIPQNVRAENFQPQQRAKKIMVK